MLLILYRNLLCEKINIIWWSRYKSLIAKKHRFYKDYTINDIDCYSVSPVKDSIELAKIIKKIIINILKLKRRSMMVHTKYMYMVNKYSI